MSNAAPHDISPNSSRSGLGKILAERLGIEILGTEGHDLKCACIACDSSDAMRIHQDDGIGFCHSCKGKWSRLELATSLMGNQADAWKLLESIGLEQPKHNGQCAAPPVDPVETVARLKHVPVESLRAYGAQAAMRDKQPCARLPVCDRLGKKSSYFDIPVSGGKGLHKKGGKQGLFLPGRLPEPGETWLLVEGPKDAAALHSLGFNAAGLPGCSLPKGFARLFRDVNVIIIPDRDVAGESGAEKTATLLHGFCSSIHIATLPAEFKKSGGADVRDVLKAKTGEQLLRQAIADAIEWVPDVSGNSSGQPAHSARRLPRVVLPGEDMTVTRCAEKLGELLANQKTHYMRGGVIVTTIDDRDTGQYSLLPIKPSRLASDFEQVAKLQIIKIQNNGERIVVPSICHETKAKLIGEAGVFRDALPKINVLSHCPVLVEQDGDLVTISGYDERSGVLASGQPAEVILIEKARELLFQLVADFVFASESDRSRALAAIITPALVLGGLLLPGRAPIDLGEADQSQTGKGYRNKITGAIYRHEPRTVNQRRGVGSLEEAFDKALITGASFIAIDNVRGKIDSPPIESFMTENTYSGRSAYTPVTDIDPRRVVVMFTSNKADITRDLANRCSCVRILKQQAGYQYTRYPEGDILEHVQGNQPLYLGAVFAMVRAWHAAGKPRTAETRHDFRAWAQTLDWIVQTLLGAAPLMDGHQETQERMTNPAMNWLRDVAQVVVRAGMAGEWLRAYQMLDLIDKTGGVEIPGLADGVNVEDEQTQRSVLSAMGRRFKKCFGDRDSVKIDQLKIERLESKDENYHRRFDYRFLPLGDPAEIPQRPRRSESVDSEFPGIEAGENGQKHDFQGKPRRSTPKPRRDPAETPQGPAEPAETSNISVRDPDDPDTSISEPLRTFCGVCGVTGAEESEQPESEPNFRAADDDEWGKI